PVTAGATRDGFTSRWRFPCPFRAMRVGTSPEGAARTPLVAPGGALKEARMRARRMAGMLAAVIAAGLALPGGAAAQYGAGQKYRGVHVGMSGVGSTAAIGVSGEMAYNDRISLGAWADTWSYGEDFATGLGSYSWNVRYIALAGTGAYHF